MDKELKSNVETFECVDCKKTLEVSQRSNSVKSRCIDCQRIWKRNSRIRQKKPLEVPNIPEVPKKETKSKSIPTTTTKSHYTNADIQDMISAGIQTSTNLVSLKFGEHWCFDENESDEIAKPLLNILNKYPFFKKAKKNMDGVMLAIAVGSAIIPKLITHITLKTLEGEVEKNDKFRNQKEKNVNGTREDIGTQNQRKSEQTSKKNSENIIPINQQDINTPYSF